VSRKNWGGGREKMKVYTFSITRNKSNKKGVSVLKQKKELFKGICEECKKDFKINQLDLDHKIPVELTGDIFKKSNLQLLCHRCHRNKSILDRKIIVIIKKLKLLRKCLSFVHPYSIHRHYFYFKDLISETEKINKNWEEGSNGEDYEQIMWKENREVFL